jgi:hypothetical protein
MALESPQPPQVFVKVSLTQLSCRLRPMTMPSDDAKPHLNWALPWRWSLIVMKLLHSGPTEAAACRPGTARRLRPARARTRPAARRHPDPELY